MYSLNVLRDIVELCLAIKKNFYPFSVFNQKRTNNDKSFPACQKTKLSNTKQWVRHRLLSLLLEKIISRKTGYVYLYVDEEG